MILYLTFSSYKSNIFMFSDFMIYWIFEKLCDLDLSSRLCDLILCEIIQLLILDVILADAHVIRKILWWHKMHRVEWASLQRRSFIIVQAFHQVAIHTRTQNHVWWIKRTLQNILAIILLWCLNNNFVDNRCILTYWV